MKIMDVRAREILDSRGNPTIETEILLENAVSGRAAVPCGASTGLNEAWELRDGDKKRFEGMGVINAVNNVNGEIKQALLGRDAADQRQIDELLIKLDGTQNKKRLGANAILSVSLAAAHSATASQKIPLYAHLRSLAKTPKDTTLPLPLCNVINGGRHAGGSTDIQEFMIAPVGFGSFRDALRGASEVFHALKKILESAGYGTTVGDEGGYAPAVRGGTEEVFDLMVRAVEKTGYTLGSDFVFAVDVAASQLYANNLYTFERERKTVNAAQLIEWYGELVKKYPIVSIEDGLAESDWENWTKLTTTLGATTQIVADDLTTTNTTLLARGIKEKSANAILIKPNQIGTLTETIDAVDAAHAAGWRAVISHRSGETEDTTISHLAVGLGTGQIKAGSLCRGERIAKYNELLRIEEMLPDKAVYAGKNALNA